MRTIFIILLLFLLAACGADAPQVTVTSEVAVTLLTPTTTAIPTPTLYPQFVTLQDQIAASGERFDLLPDGTIQETTPDGVKIVSGLSADKNGQMNLLVNGDEVALNPADISFSDKDGVKVKGYQFDEKISKWLPEVDPNQIIDLGEGLVGSRNDMTIKWENGTKLELEFASDQAKAEIKNACNIAMWAAEEAGRLGSGGDYGLNGTPVSFDEWIKRVEANGGIMSDMYRLTAHPTGETLAQAIKIPTQVDLNKCRIVLHPPAKTRNIKPFSGSIALPALGFNTETNIDGSVAINIAPRLSKELLEYPYVNENLTSGQNAEATSTVIAMWVENMDRLLQKDFDSTLILDGTEKVGDPRSIDINALSVGVDDIHTFIIDHPEATTKWIKLAK